MTETEDRQTKDLQRIRELTGAPALRGTASVDRCWNALRLKMNRMRRRRRAVHALRNAAAILFIPMLAGGLLYLQFVEHRAGGIPVEQISIMSAYGQISKIVLPDLSEVWLNSGSTLTYPQRFTGRRRTVRLAGEAYFAVSADASRRFDVQTDDGLTVSACGTEFNVNAYADDSAMKITLAKGRIEVSSPWMHAPALLNPGQQLACSRLDHTVACADVSLYVETAWREGKLIFRRAGMAEIVRQLSRRFNVDIRLEGRDLHDYEYSATFTTESIHEILSLLEKSAPIRCLMIEPRQNSDFAYTKRTVVIRPKK